MKNFKKSGTESLKTGTKLLEYPEVTKRGLQYYYEPVVIRRGCLIEHIWSIIGKISYSHLYPNKLKALINRFRMCVRVLVFILKAFCKRSIVSIFSAELNTICLLSFQFSCFCNLIIQILSIFKNVIHTKEKHGVHR